MLSQTNTTYAQNREDLILAALLDGVEKGVYIDIGANDPEVDSVTKYFYERGWTGVNVEPIKRLHAKFIKQRPKDTSLNLGISDKEGELKFREFIHLDGHSTFSKSTMQSHDLDEQYEEYNVPVITLTTLFNNLKIEHTNFLKIDVEGLEYEVIKGNDWNKNRPEVICIEANHEHKNWQDILEKFSYRRVIFDGLNEYYLAKESDKRFDGFSERLVILGHSALKKHQYVAWRDDRKQRRVLESANKSLQANVEYLGKELSDQIIKNRSLSHKIKDSIRDRVNKKRQ